MIETMPAVPPAARRNAMDIQQRLTGFAMMGATWIMWVLVGLSVGGIAVALERAIYLIRTSENVRRSRMALSSSKGSLATGSSNGPRYGALPVMISSGMASGCRNAQSRSR